MALMHGKVARIQWDAATTNVNLQHGQSWSLSVTHDVAEVTAMQDTYRTYLTGFQDWTATVECLLDSGGIDIGLGGDDGLADDTVRLELYAIYETSNYRGLYGLATCTGISTSGEKDGIVTVSYTFQSNGQLLWYSNTIVVP